MSDAHDETPPRKPRPPQSRCHSGRVVRRWHAYLTAQAGGEHPLLKNLAAGCGLSPSQTHHWCAVQSLPLSQSRPRRRRPEAPQDGT